MSQPLPTRPMCRMLLVIVTNSRPGCHSLPDPADDRPICEAEFFREATLRICGNLEIHKAMFAFLSFVNDYIPANRLFLEYFDETKGTIRFLVDATPTGGRQLTIERKLPEETVATVSARLKTGVPDPYRIEKPHENEVANELLGVFDQHAESLIIVPLDSAYGFLGNVVLVSESTQFTDEHLREITSLREPFSLAMANALRHADLLRLKDRLADDNRYLNDELRRAIGVHVIGHDHGLRSVMEKARRVASYDSPVLLSGETGVGKDVIANAIHAISERREGPFIAVNCGAIPESLIESELFGHEKGAFTGALSQKRGRFERADGGTIFLDEVGELPLQSQVRLLRVLQTQEIERVGGTKPIALNLRVIAASNRDLEMMIQQKEFREDLWFRLNVFPIPIPPLRERAADIPELLEHFLRMKARELKLSAIPGLSPRALNTLMAYNWPGNVRELGNIVERAMIMNPEGPLDFALLLPGVHQADDSTDGPSQPGTEPAGNPEDLDSVIKRHIEQVLAKVEGRIHGAGGAAEVLGINPSTLRNRMNNLGISYGRGHKARRDSLTSE